MSRGFLGLVISAGLMEGGVLDEVRGAKPHLTDWSPLHPAPVSWAENTFSAQLGRVYLSIG